MNGEAALAELKAIYGEVQKEATSRQTGQAPRELPVQREGGTAGERVVR